MNCISLRKVGKLLCIAAFTLLSCSHKEDKPLEFTPIDLDLFSRDFKGFNLLGKFDVGFSNYGFTEEEFIIMQDLGFNFARIPLDYRTYTQAGNWDVFLEDAKAENVPVMIQEFGVYNKTPHEVTLAFLTDVVTVFKSNHVGYAMWNLIGTMGIINSDRTDMTYEPYRGKLLDRKMTTIMQGSGR
jgi:aryl-phospho-beta-D-glucosidase BglC (GH1 family)